MSLRPILIVSADSSERCVLRENLCADYKILEAESAAHAMAVLARSYKVLSAVLLDCDLPDGGCAVLLSQLRSNTTLSKIPVLVTAESAEPEYALLEQGAQCVLPRPYQFDVMRLRLANLVQLRQSSALSDSAQRDPLTGLYTRDAFFLAAERLINAHRVGYYILSAFDIDKFKLLNDQYGSEKGDQVLKAVASALSHTIEPVGGICCRINADRFAVLYPAKHCDTLVSVSLVTDAVYQGSLPAATFSVGRYVVDDPALSVSSMYDRAALAKASVKGRFDRHTAVYDESMRKRMLDIQRLTDEMKPALAQQQFEPWFQPQYNSATGALIGAEALARWRHPTRGIIPPGEFIPVFEQNGFIYELDKSIWAQVCAYLRRCLDTGNRALPISINISRYDMLHDDLCDELTRLLHRYELPTSLLRLEVTESAFADKGGQVIDTVRRLVAQGFTVEIDDFGSGYSSLNTLKDVPAQIIKLDMRFLEGNDHLERGGNIIESILRMARWLGVSVIAEGVETDKQSDFLKSIGCRYVQGYHYGHPMPEADYTAVLSGCEREERLITLNTVENMDNNAFWNPKSMDTIIFNSYVGAACIMELFRGHLSVLRVSDTLSELYEELGLGTDEALRLDWGLYLGEAQMQSLVDAMAQSLRTHGSVTAEYVFTGLPGCPERVYFRCTLRVIAFTDGRYMIYCLNENLTAQRMAEQASRLAQQRAQESAQRMALVMDSISCGICASASDENGTLYTVLANDMYYDMLGYTRQEWDTELSGPMDVVFPEDLARVEDIVRDLFAHRSSAVYQYRCIKRDGSLCHVRCQNSIIAMDGVSDAVLVAVITDITDEMLAAQKISDAEQIQAVLRNVNGGVAAMTIEDGMLHYIFSNDQYSAMFGYTREQFAQELPNGLRDIIPAKYEKELLRAAMATEKIDGCSLQEFPARCRGGKRTIWVRARSSVSHIDGIDAPVHVSVLYDITKEREWHNRIQKLNDDLQSMMSDMPGGFVRMKVLPGGGITPVFVNAGFCALVGMREKEVFNKYNDSLLWGVHPDDVERVSLSLDEMLATGNVLHMSFRLAHGEGGYMWVTSFGRATDDENGVHFLNLYYSRPDAQESRDLSIRETMAFVLSATMESSTDIVFAKDRAYNYLCASPLFLRYAGKNNMADVIGKTDYDLFPPDQAARYRADDETLFSEDQALIDRLEILPDRGGMQRYISVSKYILRNSAGEPIGIYGIGRDVTNLRQAYDRLSLLTDTIPGGLAMYVISPDGINLVYYNDGFCKMMGCSREEYDALSYHEAFGHIYDEDAPLLRMQIDALVENGTPVDCTFRARKILGGGYVWINLRGALSERIGDKVHVNAVLFDVTDRRMAEQQVVNADEQLRFLNDMAHELLAQPEMSSAINRVLKKVLAHFAGSRAYVFEKSRDGLTVSNTYEACAADNACKMPQLQDIPLHDMDFLWGAFAEHRFVDIADADAQSADCLQERQFLRAQGIHSLVAVPLERDGAVLGYIGVDNPTCHLGHVNQLHALGDYLAIMLTRRDDSAVIESDRAALREKETVYRKWLQSLSDKAPEDFTLFRWSITRDTMAQPPRGKLLHFCPDPTLPFDRQTRAYAERYVWPEDREKVTTFLNAASILASYHRGSRTKSLEFRESTELGGFRWLRLTVELVEYPDIAEVETYLMFENVDELMREYLIVREQAENDPLTGVLNRAALVDRIREFVNSAQKMVPTALFMLDLDGFKQLNDTLGHAMGDQALVDMANNIRSVLRTSDLLGRLGGDEFLVCLRGISSDADIAKKAGQICALVRRSYPLNVSLSVSIGIAVFPRDGHDFDTLYRRADTALYSVKDTGKGTYAFWNAVSDELPGQTQLDSTGK